MEQGDAVAALGALAQPSRLELFRLLVRRGPAGLPAGDIAQRLGIPATTLSFHLSQLSRAGLLASRREGRSILYAADYGRMRALMAYLTEHCCEEGSCAPPPPRAREARVTERKSHGRAVEPRRRR
jgi:ArsR family transcriptional regulator, arsenate/arsenite/antimonite-responsive transcriptional repressor